MAKIEYENKENLQDKPEIANKNKVTAEDLNEIKNVVNENDNMFSEFKNNITNNIASAYIVGDTNVSEIVFDNLDMLGDGGHYHLEMQIVTTTQDDLEIKFNNKDSGYCHAAIAYQSSNSTTGSLGTAAQYYEDHSTITYWMHGSNIDFFPAKITIDLSFNTLNDGKKLVNYSIKYVNAQSGNNQFVVINGQHYNYTDNLTSIKIGCLEGMKFKKGTSGTIYKSRY